MLGIDLGTTNSLVAYFTDGEPQLIPNAHGSFLTPSVVGLHSGGDVLVGAAALELRITNPEKCAWCFKRSMGADQNYRLDGRDFSAIELSCFILSALKADAESFLGETVTEAVITVPAYFNDHQRRATKMAGEMAGLKVARILNEPTAAAIAYGLRNKETEQNIMVFDLGGGTFDVTCMEIFEGSLEIISTAGESFLGGEDFTNRLAAWSLQHVGENFELVELQQPLRLARLIHQCEEAKRKLATDEEAKIRIPAADGKSFLERELTLNREILFDQTDDLVKRMHVAMDRALRDAKLTPERIDEVVLVGGATRMKMVHDVIAKKFGRPPMAHVDPDKSVALGAAVYTALLEENVDVGDLIMTDVCPHTLGISISKNLGSQIIGGYFLPIIPRNTTIPVCREAPVETIYPSQRELLVEVYQGEARKVEGNLKLGQLEVKGLPPKPAGMVVLIRFTYDMDGILDVEAMIPSIGKSYSTVLDTQQKCLSEKELEAAKKRLQKLKFFPRDNLENERILRYAERVVPEVAPFMREQVEEAIDHFERALAITDREVFESIRDHLFQTLEMAGFPVPRKEIGRDE